MIRAMLFDMDGTLVETETLKALSYARAVEELTPGRHAEDEVVAAFGEVVGKSRREVATYIVEKFGLSDIAAARMAELDVDTPWQAFVQLRLSHFEAMMDDAELIRAKRWPHNIALLQEARRTACKLALATMSGCDHVSRILKYLDLEDSFAFIATGDDVERGKPDPEIYLMCAKELGVEPVECLVVEDSPSGVQAALAAGMWCVAVATPLTRKRLHEAKLLDERYLVDDPDTLPAVVHDIVLSQKDVPGVGGPPSCWRQDHPDAEKLPPPVLK